MAGPEKAKNRAGRLPPPDSDPFGDASLTKIPLICQTYSPQLRRIHRAVMARAEHGKSLSSADASTLALGSVPCDIVIMPKLIISDVTYELVDEAITIGRGPDNTIVVNDPSISTHHAHLLLEGDTYRLKDLDSTNGTRVNGKPVTETVLRFDDRIRFGAAEAKYQSSEVSGSKPLPKPEEIKAHFAEAGAELPHLSSASPLRRQEEQNDPVRNGILIGLGIVLFVFLGSMIAVLMMHAPSL
jgi:hypothetical protein